MKPFYRFIWTIAHLIFKIVFRMKVYHSENVPKTGAFIIACNHASYYDPPFASICVNREIHFMAKKELFDIFIMGRLITALNSHPVNRAGFDRQAVKTVLSVLENGGPTIIFPEGTRGDGIEFLPAKPGIGLLAKKSGVPVLPMYVQGTTRLSDCFWGREKLRAYIGPLIQSEEIQKVENNREGYQEISDLIMDRIKSLKAEALESL